MLKKKKFVICGLIIFVAIGFLGFIGFQHSATYYYTVSELMGQRSSLDGENIKVNGVVVPGSIEREAVGSTLKFTITEGGQSLPVVYHGAAPDTFKAGAEIVVEGHLNSAGSFQANTILTKCPSKYTPKT